MAAVPAAAAAAFLKRHLAALKLLDREIIWLAALKLEIEEEYCRHLSYKMAASNNLPNMETYIKKLTKRHFFTLFFLFSLFI
jgi:hypothetical protein